MIYKCINSLAPTYLFDLFLKRKELNNRATRNNEALHIPLFSTTTEQRSFRYRAVGLLIDFLFAHIKLNIFTMYICTNIKG